MDQTFQEQLYDAYSQLIGRSFESVNLQFFQFQIGQQEVIKMPVNNSNIPAVKTPVMVLYEKVGNGNVQFSPAASVEGGFRVTLCE